MQLLAPKHFLHEFKLVFSRGKHSQQKTSDDPGEAPLFDSGLSSIGNWILDLAVIAMITVVAGAILKWAYMAIFHN
jgi:hypothetical protein